MAVWSDTKRTLLIGLFLLLMSCRAQADRSTELRFHATLDDNYQLQWDFNDTHITFKTTVKTNGFVGFGISPNGGMPGSDVIIGWVKDGQTHFADRHALGRFMPVLDTSQDWILIYGIEQDEYTILMFVRKLETCGTDDLPILKGTTKVVYSYHPDDPADDNNIMYHGPHRRGSRSLLLLEPPTSDRTQEDAALPDNLLTFDFVQENFSVPAKETTYGCIILKLPELRGKHQMIRTEPVIQHGHENLVHHIILFYCVGHIDTRYIGDIWDRGEEVHPLDEQCYGIFTGWAVGGMANDYPPDIGHPLGTARDPTVFKLEIHYDNPSLRPDFVDNSGIRIFLTTELRQYDSGIFMTGNLVTPTQIIPPSYTNFVTSGYCTEECLANTLDDQEITVFAALLHSHLLGRKIRVRHFRNGTELPPIGEDNNYDFNYQEFRLLRERRNIKAGDSLIAECEYDSTGRSNITYGGYSTRQEMCLVFLYYFPRAPITTCLSGIQYNIPPQYAGNDIFSVVNQFDWTMPEKRAEFRQIIRESPVVNYCREDFPQIQTWYITTFPPNITSEYQQPSQCTND